MSVRLRAVPASHGMQTNRWSWEKPPAGAILPFPWLRSALAYAERTFVAPELRAQRAVCLRALLQASTVCFSCYFYVIYKL